MNGRPMVDARWRDVALQLNDALTRALDALQQPYLPTGLIREINGAIESLSEVTAVTAPLRAKAS